MAPTCGPFGPMGRLVRYVTPEAWQRAYEDAAPHGSLCGKLAKIQLRKGRHFLSEQPQGFDSYFEEPWPEVLNNPRVVQQPYHRCMTGLQAQYGPHKGMSSQGYVHQEVFNDDCVTRIVG